MFEAAAVTSSPQPAPAARGGTAPSWTPRREEASSRDAPRSRHRYDEDDDNDDMDHAPRIRHRYQTHRGDTILALGIVSLVGAFVLCVPILLGPVAWAMGAYELRGMRDGHVDPSGESQTRTGMICGIVSTALLVLGGSSVCCLILAER